MPSPQNSTVFSSPCKGSVGVRNYNCRIQGCRLQMGLEVQGPEVSGTRRSSARVNWYGPYVSCGDCLHNMTNVLYTIGCQCKSSLIDKQIMSDCSQHNSVLSSNHATVYKPALPACCMVLSPASILEAFDILVACISHKLHKDTMASFQTIDMYVG